MSHFLLCYMYHLNNLNMRRRGFGVVKISICYHQQNPNKTTVILCISIPCFSKLKGCTYQCTSSCHYQVYNRSYMCNNAPLCGCGRNACIHHCSSNIRSHLEKSKIKCNNFSYIACFIDSHPARKFTSQNFDEGD